jgi:hypothetical protein
LVLIITSDMASPLSLLSGFIPDFPHDMRRAGPISPHRIPGVCRGAASYRRSFGCQ